MRLILLLLPLLLPAQNLIDDWKCAQPNVTAGNPTVITCPNGHGFQSGTSPKLVFYGLTGNWAPLNTRILVRSLDYFSTTDTTLRVPWTGEITSLPVEIQMGLSGGDEHILCTTITDDTTISGCTRGYSGIPTALNESGYVVLNAVGEINYTATVVNDTTLTVPLDSSTFGVQTGTTHMQWASSEPYNKMSRAGIRGHGEITTDETFLTTFSTCDDPSDAAECALAYDGTTASGVVRYERSITSYTVSSNVATVEIASSAAFLEDDHPVYIKNMTDVDLNGWFRPTKTSDTTFTIPVSVSDGSKAGSSPTAIFTSEGAPLVWLHYPKIGSTLQNWRDFAFKTATWDPDVNRISFNVTFGASDERRADNGYSAILKGWPGAYYYEWNPNIYAGEKATLQFTMQPHHSNSGTATAYVVWPYDPEITSHPYVSSTFAMDEGTFDYMGEFEFYTFQPDLQGTVEFGPVRMTETSGEPEAMTGVTFLTWASDLYGAKGAGYDLSWWALNNQPCTYEIRWSATGSLKTNGWSTGSCVGSCDSDDEVAWVGGVYSGRFHQVEMDKQSQIWFGIRPTDIQISAVSGNAVSPIWINTVAWLDYEVGDNVTVASVGGNTAANQSDVAITAVQPFQTWRLPEGRLTSIVASGDTCTANTTVDHNLVKGWKFQVRGSTDATLGSTANNKYYFVASAPSAQSFTFACSGVPDGTYNTSYSASYPLSIMAWPGVAIAGTGNGDWTSGGTISPEEDNRQFVEIALTTAPPGPGAPVALTADYVLDDRGALRWSDVSASETAFIVEMDSGGGFTPVGTAPANATTYVHPGLTPSTAYSFRVKATDGVSDSGYSNVLGVNTAAHLESRLSATSVSHSAKLSYLAPAGVSCEITVTDAGGNDNVFPDAALVRARSQLLYGLAAETAYEYRNICSGGTAANAGTFTTSSAVTGTASVTASASRPAVEPSLDNFVVDYGPSPDQLLNQASTICATPRCTVSFTHFRDSAVWVQRRWCRDRASDPGCLLAANELAVSEPELILVR